MNFTCTDHLTIRASVLAAVLALAALLTACGGGGDSSVAVSSISGPSRAVANTRYTYQASPSDASGVNWNWGDGTPDSSSASVQKVWHKAGSFNTKVNTLNQNITVVGEPISAGGNHSCALQTNGSVMCWGNNFVGQVGNGITSRVEVSPVAITVLSDIVAVSAGQSHSCALKVSGSVACWGSNTNGQLGNGGTSTAVLSPADVPDLANAVGISAGESHSCALQTNGSVACWGLNRYGQLGDGSTENKYAPVAMTGLSDAVAVSAAQFHTCALKASGSVVCWGYSGYGSLGNGSTADTNVLSPVAVMGLSDAVAVRTGTNHTCALKAGGSVVCWGNNGVGQLGNGTITNTDRPVAVNGLTDAIAVSAGNSHNCAVKANGSVVCWGDNAHGQLGIGTTDFKTIPFAITGLADAVAVSAGRSHTCALKTNGSVVCWGENREGELGDGTKGDQLVPTPVTGGAIFWK
jgi:alpha-tubulin suppressor-like RCC1 family protein